MPASDEQRAKTAQRRAQCLEMKLAGARWDQIAAKLGYSGRAAACKDFQRAVEQTRAATAARISELKELELMRLDRVQAGSWNRALGGDHKAAEVVLKVHDRRVKLLDLTGAQKTVDNAVDAWIASIGAGGTDDDGLSADDQAALDAVAA